MAPGSRAPSKDAGEGPATFLATRAVLGPVDFGFVTETDAPSSRLSYVLDDGQLKLQPKEKEKPIYETQASTAGRRSALADALRGGATAGGAAAILSGEDGGAPCKRTSLQSKVERSAGSVALGAALPTVKRRPLPVAYVTPGTTLRLQIIACDHLGRRRRRGGDEITIALARTAGATAHLRRESRRAKEEEAGAAEAVASSVSTSASFDHHNGRYSVDFEVPALASR